MAATPRQFLEAACAAVKKAEPVFVRSFGKARGVSLKEGQTPSLVSDADREIEILLTKEISTRFSKHTIVGEEFPAKAKEKRSPFTWFIDPIDGTTNYIHGLAHCAISVGLWDTEGPLIGVVSDPINRARYTAVRGAGAHKNGKRIRVSLRSDLKDCLGAIGWRGNKPEAGIDLLRRLAPSAYRLRFLSSTALELCLVAGGALDFFVSESIKIYDIAAGILILEEAGGRATDWQGNSFTESSKRLVASNGSIHRKLLWALKAVPP